MKYIMLSVKILTGPKGGRYYISKKGNKVYIDKKVGKSLDRVKSKLKNAKISLKQIQEASTQPAKPEIVNSISNLSGEEKKSFISKAGEVFKQFANKLKPNKAMFENVNDNSKKSFLQTAKDAVSNIKGAKEKFFSNNKKALVAIGKMAVCMIAVANIVYGVDGLDFEDMDNVEDWVDKQSGGAVSEDDVESYEYDEQ